MMDNYVIRASEKMEEMETGARRDCREGKGRYDLIPPKPLKRLALVYEKGANKYGENNWKKGMKVSRVLDSALRHIFLYMEGDDVEDHLAQAAWNIFAALEFDETELNDIETRKRKNNAAIQEEIKKLLTFDEEQKKKMMDVFKGNNNL
jgi:hypothetical protein